MGRRYDEDDHHNDPILHRDYGVLRLFRNSSNRRLVMILSILHRHRGKLFKDSYWYYTDRHVYVTNNMDIVALLANHCKIVGLVWRGQPDSPYLVEYSRLGEKDWFALYTA